MNERVRRRLVDGLHRRHTMQFGQPVESRHDERREREEDATGHAGADRGDHRQRLRGAGQQERGVCAVVIMRPTNGLKLRRTIVGFTRKHS